MTDERRHDEPMHPNGTRFMEVRYRFSAGREPVMPTPEQYHVLMRGPGAAFADAVIELGRPEMYQNRMKRWVPDLFNHCRGENISETLARRQLEKEVTHLQVDRGEPPTEHAICTDYTGDIYEFDRVMMGTRYSEWRFISQHLGHEPK